MSRPPTDQPLPAAAYEPCGTVSPINAVPCIEDPGCVLTDRYVKQHSTRCVFSRRAECRFGWVEHDGFQYCHEHFGWHHYTDRTQRCDRAALTPPP